MSLDEVKRIKQLNKNAIVNFKDKLDGVPLQEFVGLRPKLYSLLYENAGVVECKKTAKGVKRVVKDRHLSLNSIWNEFDSFKYLIDGNMEIILLSETKLNDIFPVSQFLIHGFHAPYRADRPLTGWVSTICS